MSEPSPAITLFVMLGGALFWTALYVTFAIAVTHQANPVVAKRWKAAVVQGISQGIFSIFVFLVLGIVLLSTAIFKGPVTPVQINAAWFASLFQTILSAIGCLSCIIIPTMFLTTIGSYGWFIQHGDVLVEKFSKYLK